MFVQMYVEAWRWMIQIKDDLVLSHRDASRTQTSYHENQQTKAAEDCTETA